MVLLDVVNPHGAHQSKKHLHLHIYDLSTLFTKSKAAKGFKFIILASWVKKILWKLNRGHHNQYYDDTFLKSTGNHQYENK